MAEDCGPRLQIAVKLGEEARVPAETLRGILAGDHDRMGPDASLVHRFANASLARDMATTDPLRDAVRSAGGPRLAAIALAMAAARVYPTIKYAMGHGKTLLARAGRRRGGVVRA
jgi:hypothetical protein